MTDEAKAGCVLRLYGVSAAAVEAAVSGFSPQWNAKAQWKSRAAETLVALEAQSPSGLKKAEQALRERFAADLYGEGETTLAEAAVAALEQHDRLLICSDAAAGTRLEARLETVAGAEKVFDFGALSYAHPKTGAQIERQARARLPKDCTDPVRRTLARAQAARRLIGADLAAGCAERENDCVLVLSCKKGCFLRTIPLEENPALWLLDMIRRAAGGQKAGPLGRLSARPPRRKNGPAGVCPAAPKAAPLPAVPVRAAAVGGPSGAVHRRGVGLHRRKPLRPARPSAFALGRKCPAFRGVALIKRTLSVRADALPFGGGCGTEGAF